jgi:hypothetical protein
MVLIADDLGENNWYLKNEEHSKQSSNRIECLQVRIALHTDILQISV